MRRAAILSLATVIVAGGAIWALRSTTARPRVEAAERVVDFGPIAEKTTKSIVMRNAGRAPLRILAVSSSCGCTTATMEATVLPPGGASRLAITFDPVAHGPQLGPAQHAVYVRTNDERTPEVEIEVLAVVRKGSTQ